MSQREPFDVTGRGLKAGRVSLTTDDVGAMIRVDDDERPEFWLYIRITREKLREVLASVDAHASAQGDYFNNGLPPIPPTWSATDLPDIPPATS